MRTTILAGLLLCGCMANCQDSQYGNQFPDAPEPIKQDAAGHWRHDKSQDPPKWYQHTLTQHCQAKGTCLEGGGDVAAGGQKESRSEAYTHDMIADGVIIGFATIVQSRHFPRKWAWIAYIAPTYGTAVHLKGIAKGLSY